MRIARLAAFTATMAFATAPVSGQTQFLDFQAGSGVNFNGWQVGTYTASLAGNQINIWCTDFYNHAADGMVYVTTLGDAPDLSHTRFGPLSNQPARYQQAAYLTSLFTASNHSEWGYIQYAIWHLMSQANPAGPTTGLTMAHLTSIGSYLSLASANYQQYSYDGFYILTHAAVSDGTGSGIYAQGCTGISDKATCGNQEFLSGRLGVREQVVIETPTPEPATIGLMATGLVGLVGVGLRRKRRLDS